MKSENKKDARLYGVCVRNRDTNKIYGYIEHSFSMDMSATHIRVWRGIIEGEEQLKSARHAIKNYKHYKPFKNHDIFLVRLNAKSSPIKITWGDMSKKFTWRNAMFSQTNIINDESTKI